MRTRSVGLGLLILGIAILTFAGSSPAPAEEQVTLRYSVFFPATHVQSKLAEEWAKEVEKRTNGKVKIEYYPGQTLTKADQVYDGVVSGISDIGFSVLGYTRGRFPMLEVIDLPLGYKNGVQATKVANDVYKQFKDKALTDTQVMYLHAHGPGLVHTKGKAVRKLEDMKGLKIRSHGTSAKVVKALGGTPVAQPMPETYQSLEKGVVNGAVYPLEANKGWKLGEVIDYATLNFPAAYTTTFFVVMNKDKWNALPDDVKKTIVEINEEWIGKHGKAWDESDEEGVEFLKSKNKEMIELDAEEGKKWADAVKPVLDEFVVEMEKKNLPGKEALEAAQKSFKEGDK
ncbi:MAG: TRAP transporter substrate-binding protein [Desulfomonilaceae bacterium]|nr:TRAP transporter substrate-binding protein [Desulfomonilaceae bacterium]